MQSLQMERRQRTEEYLRQRTDWPGFNDQRRSYLEDLWDPSPAMGQQASSSGLNQYNQQSTTQAWGGGGGTLEDVWPTASWLPTQQSSFSVQQPLQQGQINLSGMNATATDEVHNNQGLGFNPMQLSSIWNSPTMKTTDEMNHSKQDSAENKNSGGNAPGPWNGSLFNN